MTEEMKIILSIVIVIVCVFLFIGTYILNKKTKNPEGCEEISENCSACTISSCSHTPKEKGEINND